MVVFETECDHHISVAALEIRKFPDGQSKILQRQAEHVSMGIDIERHQFTCMLFYTVEKISEID